MGFDFCSFVLFAYLSARRPAIHLFASTSPYSAYPRSIDRDIIAIIAADRSTRGSVTQPEQKYGRLRHRSAVAAANYYALLLPPSYQIRSSINFELPTS